MLYHNVKNFSILGYLSKTTILFNMFLFSIIDKKINKEDKSKPFVEILNKDTILSGVRLSK